VHGGQLYADTGLENVARSSGWPIHTSQGYLFATRDQGQGPYALESPTGGFAPVEMKTGGGLAWALVQVASPDGVEYRFHPAQLAASSDPLSRYFTYFGDDTLSFVVLTGRHLGRSPRVGEATMPAPTP